MTEKIWISGHDMHFVDLPHEEEQFAYFVAKHDDEIVAVAKASPWSNYEKTPDIRPFISGVHVEEAFRGQGVGTGLMKYIETVAGLQKIKSLALYVHKDNYDAIWFYEKLGYRPVLDDGDNRLLVKFIPAALPDVQSIIDDIDEWQRDDRKFTGIDLILKIKDELYDILSLGDTKEVA